MHKKIGITLGVLLALTLLLAACGGPDDNSPEGAVKRFFEKLGDKDASGVENLLCQDYRQNVDFELTSDQKVSLKFDLKYKEQGTDQASSDTTGVIAYGKIDIKLQEPGVTIERKEQRNEDSAWNVRTFKQGDTWLVCGMDAGLLDLLNLEGLFASMPAQ